MLPTLSIKSLYTLALAEGEGVGTAYEYFAKRLVLDPWLRQMPVRPGRILIAGLPQKYGSSLDFLQLAADLQAAVTIVDERPAALAQLQTAQAVAQAQGWLTAVQPRCQVVDDMSRLTEVAGEFDLCLSSEVLQRLTAESRPAYVHQLRQLAPALALFAPNAENPAHTHLSGLNGLSLGEIKELVSGDSRLSLPGSTRTAQLVGYIDLPPFPPGVIRSESQRAQANSGRLEATAMWGLGYYARLEKFLPLSLRRRQAHIVYGMAVDD